jgi:hypothetical protein
MLEGLVYHYTNLDGLMGILRRRQLWATDIRFLNDTTEAHYGQQQLDENLRVAVDEDQTPDSSLLNELADWARHWKATFRPFVACFSQNSDQLSQWRGYGRLGYAIGFDYVTLTKIGYREPSFNLNEMLYDRAEVSRAILTALSLAREDRLSPEHVDMVTWLASTSNRLFALATSFKDPSFAEEAEIRALVLLSEQSQSAIKVRPGPLGPTPYVSIDLDIPDGVVIREVVIGPTGHPVEAEQGVKDLLQHCDMSPVEVRRSCVPLRW